MRYFFVSPNLEKEFDADSNVSAGQEVNALLKQSMLFKINENEQGFTVVDDSGITVGKLRPVTIWTVQQIGVRGGNYIQGHFTTRDAALNAALTFWGRDLEVVQVGAEVRLIAKNQLICVIKERFLNHSNLDYLETPQPAATYHRYTLERGIRFIVFARDNDDAKRIADAIGATVIGKNKR